MLAMLYTTPITQRFKREPYISWITYFRTIVQNDFEKDPIKLLPNSVFCKDTEKKERDLSSVTKKTTRNKIHFKEISFIPEDFQLTEKKSRVKPGKPLFMDNYV